ncbi:hypothetical protein [Flavihumibacter sp. ZG627]|uniref:hypothetical protein n=1 Tax=Flavihumibacter sp. ZG627 TaxID=1463156 RepID=UPI0005805710|nr:hypothetical protein [Flavihumibacter sp. ZG627]KIC91849.1 hypothetical protein HY58_06450 [Flavihumibacter sp. ZG627]
MQKFKWLLALAAPLALMISCQKEAARTDHQITLDETLQLKSGSHLSASATGNGAPSGAHYNLNIIGVPKGKTADMTSGNGHRIFVNLSGNTKIFLKEGDDFAVLDANGTDQDGAKFQLPNPDPENDGITTYSVFARALGKPGGSMGITTCAYDPSAGEDVCSLESYVTVRNKGRTGFENVSKELLYIYADLDGDGTVERYPLFDDRLQDYYWSVENDGLRLLQLRFYAVPTNVN